MSLSDTQVGALLQPLHAGRVGKDPKGNAHLEAWDVRRHLLRIFGWGGWSDEILTCDLVRELEIPPTQPNGKSRWTVVYRVTMRLTITDPAGQPVAVFEDGACGDATNQPSLGDAHDQAMKTALSQALKRCAVNLGDQFGLSLYNDGQASATVLRSLPHSAAGHAEQKPGAAEAEHPAVGEHSQELSEPDQIRESIREFAASQQPPWRLDTIAAGYAQQYPGRHIRTETDVEALTLFYQQLQVDAQAAADLAKAG
jgi:predicted transcriptional regulator